MFWYLESIEIPEKPRGLFGERYAPALNLFNPLYQMMQASAVDPSASQRMLCGGSFDRIFVLMPQASAKRSNQASIERDALGTWGDGSCPIALSGGSDSITCCAERSGTAKISEDQKRVHRATKKDNAYLQVSRHSVPGPYAQDTWLPAYRKGCTKLRLCQDASPECEMVCRAEAVILL